MAQQTAVQCLIDELRSGKNLQLEMTKCGHIITEHDNVLNKILQMEKDQIIEFANKYAESDSFYCNGEFDIVKGAEQYYNETFGNK